MLRCSLRVPFALPFTWRSTFHCESKSTVRAKKILSRYRSDSRVGPLQGEPQVEIRKFGTIRSELEALRNWLKEQEVTHVVMEKHRIQASINTAATFNCGLSPS